MVQANQNHATREQLGPAERIIESLTGYRDHCYHNRTGIVRPSRDAVGKTWQYAVWKLEEGKKNVYAMSKSGKKDVRTLVGVMGDDGKVIGTDIEFRGAGLFPEVVAHLYQQVADVWAMDNEFAARWASWAMTQDHRDTKAVLCAFMLVQNRSGRPVMDGDRVAFRDDDFRVVGEAMMLAKDFDPKMLLRVGNILLLKEVAAINRKLGFGVSATRPAAGRYKDVVWLWLKRREQNPKLLDGLLKGGFRSQIMELAALVGYKPTTTSFFQKLRWKQKQSPDGRRAIGIGDEVAEAESWKGLSEEEICLRIERDKPNFKVLSGRLPAEVGLTRAIVCAAVEAGSLSDADLIILTPTLEDLGLLNTEPVKGRHAAALKNADNRRAANIAMRVRSQEVSDTLDEAADNATKKAVEAATRGIFVRIAIDISSSMREAIERSKVILAKFVQGFPPDRVGISVFNSQGRRVTLKEHSAAGVAHAFSGIAAGGNTSYFEGVRVFLQDEKRPEYDNIFIFVGDQEDGSPTELLVQGLKVFEPVALMMLDVKRPRPEQWVARCNTVGVAGALLGIPVIPIDERIFGDAYASVEAIRHLISSVPVRTAHRVGIAEPAARVSLIDQILKTDLLVPPDWSRAYRMAKAA